MKLKNYFVQLTTTLLVLGCLSTLGQSREMITLQTGWKFAKGSNEKASQIKFDDSKWQNVAIPHDWAIAEPTVVDGDGNTGKLPWKGEGWYRKNLEIPASYSGKNIILIFDGIMSRPEVYLNGQLAGKWDYGYNSFYLDVTKLASPGGKNLLAIHAGTTVAGIRVLVFIARFRWWRSIRCMFRFGGRKLRLRL